jgi:hypothetical protein
MIEGRGVLGTDYLPPIFVLIEMFDSSVHSDMFGIGKVFHVSGAVWSFMLFDPYSTGMGYGH